MEAFLLNEIEKLKAEQKQLETSFHRISGAILAYEVTLAEIRKQKTSSGEEPKQSADNE